MTIVFLYFFSFECTQLRFVQLFNKALLLLLFRLLNDTDGDWWLRHNEKQTILSR